MRLQLALNVKNLEDAIGYYSKLFDVPVAKRKPGYANFVVEQPPLKLVLFEVPDATERLNHVGVELLEDSQVEAAITRLDGAGLADKVIRAEKCCYADKSTVYSLDPQGLMWELYKKQGDLDEFAD